MIRGFWGPVGSGKSYTGVYTALEDLRRGRGVAASWSINGAKYLFTLSDALSDEYRGFKFLIDEVGGKFSSRQSDNLDHVAMNALQQSRHNLVDCDMFGQHPRQLDIVARELIEEHHFCTRIGFSGEGEQRSGKRSWWCHPWAIMVKVWHKDDFDETWKPLRSSRHVYFVPWLRAVAGMYNSWDRVVPDEVSAWLSVVQDTAHLRFAVPAAIVRDSKVVPQILPQGFQLLMPPKRSLRAKGDQVVGSPYEPSRAYLAAAGLYSHDDPHAPPALMMELQDIVVGPARNTTTSSGPCLPLSGPELPAWASVAPGRSQAARLHE